MSVICLPGSGWSSNIYLVKGEEPFLVDTGAGDDTERVLRMLKKNADTGRVRRIVLTHRHPDHVGGAALLKEELSAEVFIHELDAPALTKASEADKQAELFGTAPEPIEVTPFSEGEVISTGDREFRVLHTPGHTIGSVSLFDEADGSLISGDTVFVGGYGRWDFPTGSYDDLVRSIRRLSELRAVDLYPGHGPTAIGAAGEQIVCALRYLGDA